MADIKPIGKAFLREEELRRGIEMMFFSYVILPAKPTQFWRNKIWDGRIIVPFFHWPPPWHHCQRSLFYITKQSLSRVLSGLMKDGFVLQKQAPPTAASGFYI